MSRNFSLALLAGASLLIVGVDRAAAFDGDRPDVIYANDPQASVVRSANADRAGMGGGFMDGAAAPSCGICGIWGGVGCMGRMRASLVM